MWSVIGLILLCAPAPHAGENIAIVEESALIVWEPAASTEHFIRRATFRGKGRDFGFLVPTPSVPTLAEADDAIFARLEEWAKPKTVYVKSHRVDWTPWLMMYGMRHETATTAARPVEVLASQKIAGYDAVVLDATDSAALQKWLADHGYTTTPDLTAWLEAYVSQHWKITAFKIDASQPEARTGAVKMSFTTPRPFFPYREPASQREYASSIIVNRILRIFFLGPERVTATIGASTPWQGDLRRSNTPPATLGFPTSMRLTAFEDWSSIRPGFDDLFFSRAADQRPFTPPDNTIEDVKTTHLPLDVLAVIAIVAIVVIRRVSR
ncbi:MAG TPA: DUF2330 domain-containing protein [Thermoanaerobaculia bacterium]|nr:DUF2330 domain-containing protein [Thermoanaerobaculia bacterium]